MKLIPWRGAEVACNKLKSTNYPQLFHSQATYDSTQLLCAIRNQIISVLIKNDVAHVQLVTDLQHDPFAAAGDADCSIRHSRT